MLVQIQTRQPKLTSITHFWARMRAVATKPAVAVAAASVAVAAASLAEPAATKPAVAVATASVAAAGQAAHQERQGLL